MSGPADVAVNLLWLAPGRVGGSEESTLASLRAVSDEAPDDLALRLLCSRELLDAHPDLAERFRVETAPVSTVSRPPRLVAESTWLAARTRGAALVHHAGGTVPPVRTAPALLTLHDLQPLEARATHGRVKRAYLAVAVPRSLAAARVVVVPSEHVAGTVRARFPEVAERLVVVHHGVTTGPGTTEDVLRRRYDLPGPVVLYPGITYPHKNHALLVRAFAAAAADHPDAVLVLPGGPGQEETAVLELARTLGVGDRVRRPGRIPAEDVQGLYRLATVVAVPSRYEGFGLPAAEGLVHGRAVVAASATALPEVVGDAGLLVDPDDLPGWTAALARLLGDPGERARLEAAARARAPRFSWSANAQGLLAAYRRALVGRRR